MKVSLTILLALAVCLGSTQATATCKGGQCRLQLAKSICEACILRGGECEGCGLPEALLPFLGHAFLEIRGAEEPSSPAITVSSNNAVEYTPFKCFTSDDCSLPCLSYTADLKAYTCNDMACWCEPGRD